MSTAPEPALRPNSAWMFAAVGLAALVNLITLPLGSAADRGPPGAVFVAMIAFLAGIIAAETGVLAMLLVWSPWPLWRKLTVHWAAARFLLACWAAGFAIMSRGDPYAASDMPQILVVTALALPPISLAVQLPLWLCRTAFGWRLVPTFSPPPAERKLAISDLLAGTTVVAISLGCLRMAVFNPRDLELGYWAGWGIGILTLAALSGLLLLPLVALVLRPKEDTTAVSLTLVFVAVLISLVVLPMLAMMSSMGPSPDGGAALLAVSTFFIGFGGTLALPLWILRRQGYRLRFRSEYAWDAPAGTASPFRA